MTVIVDWKRPTTLSQQNAGQRKMHRFYSAIGAFQSCRLHMVWQMSDMITR